ncbi:MAG: hypothetical protein ACRDUY_01640 [Nitriliruptorales bacterium]
MDRPAPRLTAVLGVARAVLETLALEDAVDVLVAEFGWDTTFQTLALLRGEQAGRAFAVTWERLLVDPIRRDLAA